MSCLYEISVWTKNDATSARCGLCEWADIYIGPNHEATARDAIRRHLEQEHRIEFPR